MTIYKYLVYLPAMSSDEFLYLRPIVGHKFACFYTSQTNKNAKNIYLW